ncbi:MAG: hypothetical protein AB7F76_00205 [Parvibaculaceae bacterium]|jgi:hypothetical protein
MILIADSDSAVSVLKSQAFCMACLIFRKRRNKSPSAEQKHLIRDRLARLILDDERYVTAAADFALKGLAQRKSGDERIRRKEFAA